MDFTYIATGGLQLTNCAGPNSITYNISTTYAEGDSAYVKYRALKGKLEKVFIKKINLIDNLRWNYQDTTNRLWLENELISLEDAEEYIHQFEVKREAAYMIALKHCKAILD